MRVALLANLKKNAPSWPGMSPDQWDDLDSEETIEAIVQGLQVGGHEVEFFEANLSLVETLPPFRPDICFNIAESHWGDSRESQVPALLEMMRIPYTGSRVMSLALALDKAMTKRVLAFHSLPTPPSQSFERVDEPLDDDMTFPMFVKPTREGTGMGVSAKSIVHNELELRRQIKECYFHGGTVSRQTGLPTTAAHLPTAISAGSRGMNPYGRGFERFARTLFHKAALW